MSLATSGGIGAAGGATGGLVLGHQAGGALGHPGAGPQAPPQAADTGHGAAPPSAAVLGADLLDKQHIALKQVKNLSHLPLVAVDLYGGEHAHVALFPKKPLDPSEAVPPMLVGKMKPVVAFKADEQSHKTLRKYLAKSKTYQSLREDSIAKPSDPSAVLIEQPQRWLGLRRLEDYPAFLRDKAVIDSDSLPAIAEESSQASVIANSTLDGSTPTGDDFDRVVCKVRLHPTKKALTILPEEATQLLLHQARSHVATKIKAEDADEVCDYPAAVALPAWAMHDASLEALSDATDNRGVFFPRSLCAAASTLMVGADGQPNAVLERIQKVREAMAKEFQRVKAQDPSAVWEEEVLIILVGIVEDGVECTAVQVSNVQQELPTCLFGDYKVLANVSYQTEDPLSRLEQCCKDLESALEAVAPDADGPSAILTYGASSDQDKVTKQWNAVKSSLSEWTNVPVFSSKPEAVALGAAILGAVAHGRQLVLVDKDGKTKADLGIRVDNVAPAAVGVRFNYYDADKKKWEPVKTIFDFDRRIPAGPYAIDLKASECALQRKGASSLHDEAFVKAVKEMEASKHIPEREEAALALRVEIVQKWTRDGEWKRVGDIMEPLVKRDVDDDSKKIACESVDLEISLGVNGMITTSLVGDR